MPRNLSVLLRAALLFALLSPPAMAFDLQGHRGARGLAPENTLAGFREALEIGVTTLETDLAVTKDGILVISHDADLNPALVRDGNFWIGSRGPAIRTLALADLKRYDIGRVNPSTGYGKQWPLQVARDGERFPTLVEVFALTTAVGKPVRFNLETKLTPTSDGMTVDAETFAQLTVDAVRKSGMVSRTTIQSFDWRTLIAVRRLAPEIPTSCLTQEGGSGDTVKPDASGRSPWHAGIAASEHDGSVPRMVRAAGCTTWSANYASLTRERITEAHELGLRVLPWTVNEPADMARLIDMGADGLITDYPDRARRVMAEKGLPLP